ncbi:MAG TPA: hypothetical protein VL997_15530 [Dyella sp.]|nr:hypothetical protein [Dyella sp.]
MARATIIELTGPKFEKVLYAPPDLCKSGSVYSWFRDAVEKVLELADVIKIDDPLGGQRRAICPLCRAEAQNFYNHGPGFTYPEGLRRHLHGSHRSAQCPVTEAAHELAIDRRDRRNRLGQ